MAEKQAGGVVKKGHEEGTKMAVSLLEEFGLPSGLLPLVDVIEVGFVRSTGYMWILQKKKVCVCKFKFLPFGRFFLFLLIYLRKNILFEKKNPALIVMMAM